MKLTSMVVQRQINPLFQMTSNDNDKRNNYVKDCMNAAGNSSIWDHHNHDHYSLFVDRDHQDEMTFLLEPVPIGPQGVQYLVDKVPPPFKEFSSLFQGCASKSNDTESLIDILKPLLHQRTYRNICNNPTICTSSSSNDSTLNLVEFFGKDVTKNQHHLKRELRGTLSLIWFFPIVNCNITCILIPTLVHNRQHSIGI